MSLKSISNESPSSYANSFVELSISNYLNKDNLKMNIKGLLNIFSFSKLDMESQYVKRIRTMKCTLNSKELRLAKNLITYLDGDTNCSHTAEHYICQSSLCNEKYKFGNIIPVNIDPFKDISPEEKIEEYKKVAHVEKHIQVFLQHVNEGKNIDERTDYYIERLVNKWNSLYDYIMEKEV